MRRRDVQANIYAAAGSSRYNGRYKRIDGGAEARAD
jgi:hypothetical protein